LSYEKGLDLQKKRLKGFWVGWYESGKRKAKALPSKALTEHYRQIQYTQLNSDVFTETITIGNLIHLATTQFLGESVCMAKIRQLVA